MKTSVVIPAYNEGTTIEDLVGRIYKALGRDNEVIVVDDGSSDSTAAAAERGGACVLKNPYRMGNGASVKRGMRAAAGEVIVFMDADGQHPPEEIPGLLSALEGHDMAIGARRGYGQAWPRRIANAVFNRLATYVSGVNIEDLTSGFRAFKKDKALKFIYLLPNTFSYPATLTLSFIKAALAVRFIPVNVKPRQAGKSKIHLFSDGTRFLIIILRIAVFFSPLKVFLPVSAAFFLMGAAYYLYTYAAFHRFTNMSALLFTTSVIIFMLGLVSEQVASLKMEKTEQ